MALFSMTTSVDKSAAEISKLRAVREKLESEDIADRAKLAELKAGQGEVELGELLGNGKAVKPKDNFPVPLGDAKMLRFQIMEVQLRIEGRASARPKLFERIREAVKAHAHARGQAIRKAAEPLRAKYDSHMAETARLVAELEKHSECPWEMRLIEPPRGAYLPQDVRHVVPRFRIMQAELEKLLSEAERIEAEGNLACEGGAAVGASLEELLAAIGDNPLAPSRPEIEAWHSEAEARAVAEWHARFAAQGVTPSFERNPLFTVMWGRDGAIDRQQSIFQNRELRSFPVARTAGPVAVPAKVA